jgi:transcriptional regulator with XRE-family HTH domain
MSKRKGSSRGKRTTELGKYLTFIRVSQGKTQQEIAERIGMSRSRVCRIERGQRVRKCLRGFILYQLARAYDAPIDDVLKKANWPQLLLIDTNEQEKQDLIRYLRKNL